MRDVAVEETHPIWKAMPTPRLVCPARLFPSQLTTEGSPPSAESQRQRCGGEIGRERTGSGSSEEEAEEFDAVGGGGDWRGRGQCQQRKEVQCNGLLIVKPTRQSIWSKKTK